MSLRLGITVCSILLCFACCKHEKPPVTTSISNGSVVLVLNEGNFSWGNGSVDLYDPELKEVTQSIFESNNNRPLGDVIQSAALIDGDLWIVVNNSGKIEVVDTSNFKSIKTISGLQSPRYIANWGQKVLVTDLYAEKVAVVNASTYALEASINESGWTEQIVVDNGEFFILNKDSNWIARYNSSSAMIIHESVKGKLFDLVQTKTSIYAASYIGDSVVVKDLINQSEVIYANVLKNVPSKLLMSESPGKWIIKVGNDLLKLNDSNKFEKIFGLNSGSLYGVSVVNNEIYVSDAKDYTQRSELIRLNMDGAEIDRKEVGIIANGFIWLP